MNYVSCSPYRVPIARLAAARAVLGISPQRLRPGRIFVPTVRQPPPIILVAAAQSVVVPSCVSYRVLRDGQVPEEPLVHVVVLGAGGQDPPLLGRQFEHSRRAHRTKIPGSRRASRRADPRASTCRQHGTLASTWPSSLPSRAKTMRAGIPLTSQSAQKTRANSAHQSLPFATTNSSTPHHMKSSGDA